MKTAWVAVTLLQIVVALTPIDPDSKDIGITIPKKLKDANAVNKFIKEFSDLERNPENAKRNTVKRSSKLECNLDQALVDEINSYQEIVDDIISYVTEGSYKGETWKSVAELADNYGGRLPGSTALDDAIDHLVSVSEAEGLDNVYTEDVTVPHWVRGEESAMLISPREEPLSMMSLGYSVGTPVGGIEAEVLVVKSFEELANRSSEAAGRIVVYNEDYVSYGVTAEYRSMGASMASLHGGVAALIRSITPFSINSPHTGMQSYSEDVDPIPAACITIEDAQMLHRMQERGENIVIHLEMEAENLPDVTSRNTIVELSGIEKPEESVLLSGHLDAWDVGQGAMDNGAGTLLGWNTIVILSRMGLRPRRTIRSALWTAEEIGVIGSQLYYEAHKEEADLYQFMIESDQGAFNPLGLGVAGGNDELTCIIQEILQLTQFINTTEVSEIGSAGEINIWTADGVPTAALQTENDEYFWFHHSGGDTIEVLDPVELDKCVALWASVAYVTADLKDQLPRV